MITMNGGKKIILNKTLVIITIIAFAATILSGCIEETTEVTEVKVEGSTTVLPIASSCAEAFNNQHDDIQVTITGGGSGAGINAVASGKAQIGMASRPAKASDVEDVEGVELADLVDNIVAYDIIAIIISSEVYNDNVTDLTTEQVKGIYNGSIDNWNEIPSYTGDSKEINVVERESGSGTRDTFMSAIFGSEDAETDADLSKNSNALVKSSVQNNDNAIGYVGLGYVSTETPSIKLNGIEAAGPNYEQYDISRALHMYTLGTPESGSATDMFLDFVLGEEGQEFVEDEDFLKVSVVEG